MLLSIRTLTCKQAATYEHLSSDVLLRMKPLSTSLVFSLPSGRSPHRVLAPPGTPNTSADSYLPTSVHDVSRRTLLTLRREPPPSFERVFNALPVHGLDVLLPELPTCASFRTFQPNLSKSLEPNVQPLVTIHFPLSDLISKSEDSKTWPETSKFQASRSLCSSRIGQHIFSSEELPHVRPSDRARAG